jgi:hypothetical protein
MDVLMKNKSVLAAKIRRIRSVYCSSGSMFYTLFAIFQYLVNKRIPAKQINRVCLAPTREFLSSDAQEKFIIAFRISGGLGDHLTAARYIRDLFAVIGGTRFDIYSSQPEVAQWVFSQFPELNDCFDETFAWSRGVPSYPLAIWITQFVYIHCNEANWWLIQKYSNALIKICKKINLHQIKISSFIENHPFSDGFLSQVITFDNMKRSTFLQGMSGITYGGDRLSIKTQPYTLEKFSLVGKNYITVHNGFDAEFKIAGKNIQTSSTKHYPHFAEVISILKTKFPQLHVIQLGTTTSRPIMNVDTDLINKTTLPEMAAILKNSLMHIDNESGLVHLATCLGIKSCVIFGPTPADYYGYETNINIRPNFCGNCWWITEDWMRICPRGFETARCMSEQPATAISSAITPYLSTHFTL